MGVSVGRGGRSEFQQSRFARGSRELRELCDALQHVNTRVDLTLRLWVTIHAPDGVTYRRPINDDLVVRDVVRFMNRLNAYVLKISKKVSKPPKVDALIVLERNGPEGRPHLHGLIERPAHLGVQEFKALVLKAWVAQTVSYEEHVIEPVDTLDRSVSYNLKYDDSMIAYYHVEKPERAWWRAERPQTDARLAECHT